MRALHAVLVAAIVTFAGVTPAVVAPASVATDASLDRVGAWQAPANATDLDDAADVRSAIDDGSLSRATDVDGDDTLVLGIEVRGFADAVSDANGSTTTNRVLSALSEHGDLVVEQTNPGPSQRPAAVHVLEGRGVRAFADAANDTYYAVIDLDEVRVTRGDDGEEVALTRGSYSFLVRAELAADSPLTEERQRALTPIEPRSASVETAPDGKVHVQPSSNFTLSGTTNVGSGWPVTAVLAGDDDPDTATDESFQATRQATVEPPEEDEFHYEGTYDATFDEGAVPVAAENVTVDVRFDGGSLLDEPIPVEVADRRASVAISGEGEDGQFTGVTVNTSLSAGGFLVLHEESMDGPVVGHTEYLDSGDHTVSVYVSEPTDADEVVVVAHRDANHNEWFDGPDADPAYAGDDPDDAIALGPTQSPTTREGETASSETDTTSSPTDAPSSSATTPGFGAVAAILGLLVALAVLGRR
jgi:PGF-CTERM protein